MLTYTMHLDVSRTGPQGCAVVRCGDRQSHCLELLLHAGGTPITLPQGATAVLRACKPDGYAVFNACTIEGSLARHVITRQETIAPGTMDCTLAIYAPDGSILYSPTFLLEVEPVFPQDASITSTAEFTALQDALTETTRIRTAWAHPTISIANGPTPDASIALTEDGVHLDLTVQPGKDGIPARLGETEGCLVETGEGGTLVPGRKLVVGEGDPAAVEALRPGDLYFRTDRLPLCLTASATVTLAPQQWTPTEEDNFITTVPLQGAGETDALLASQSTGQGFCLQPSLCHCGNNTATLYATGQPTSIAVQLWALGAR